MCSVAERASGPLILAPGGMPGAVPMGVMMAGEGAAWLTAEAALAPAGPAPPISAAATRLAVYADRVNRFSIRVPRDRPPMIKGMLEAPSAAAGDHANRARPAQARACCS